MPPAGERKPSAGSLRAVVFDFDGVILESVEIKTRAFAALFERWPEHRDEIVRLHLENAGVSRYEKFVRIYREILDEPLAKGELERLGEQFSRLVYDEILGCDFVPGAHEFLERLARDNRLFVASGTPEEEMRDIVGRRGLARFFAGVYGSPASKGEILRRILREEELAPNELVFVGDAVADYEGAREAGVPFIARVQPGEEDHLPQEGVLVRVSDLAELDRRWDTLVRAVREWSP